MTQLTPAPGSQTVVDERTDFRLEKLGGAPTYHVPADAAARAALDTAFARLSGVAQGVPATITEASPLPVAFVLSNLGGRSNRRR